MIDSEIRQLIVQYNLGRRRGESDYGRSECSQDEFDMLQVIIEDLESYGFTDFRYDDSQEAWRQFILCNYGPMICRIDISTADRHRANTMDASAELAYLQEVPGYTLVHGRLTTWRHPTELCRWGWGMQGTPFRMRDVQLHKLILG